MILIFLNVIDTISNSELKIQVLVHSGGMQCGHYTGYIRPFLGDKDPERADRWFCFDDDHVYSVPSKEAVESNFGGSGRPSRRAKSKRRKIVLDSDDKGGSENKMEDDDDEDYSDVFSLLPSTGGSSSCAYMLAYVRERDLDKVMNSSFLVRGVRAR